MDALRGLEVGDVLLIVLLDAHCVTAVSVDGRESLHGPFPHLDADAAVRNELVLTVAGCELDRQCAVDCATQRNRWQPGHRVVDADADHRRVAGPTSARGPRCEFISTDSRCSELALRNN